MATTDDTLARARAAIERLREVEGKARRRPWIADLDENERPVRVYVPVEVDRCAALLRLAEAAAALSDQLRVVREHPAYLRAWEIAQVHDGRYAGPTYANEREALDAALAQLATLAGDDGEAEE